MISANNFQHKSDFKIEVDEATRARAFDAFLANIKNHGRQVPRREPSRKQSEAQANSNRDSRPASTGATRSKAESHTERKHAYIHASSDNIDGRSLRRSRRKEQLSESISARSQLRSSNANMSTRSTSFSSTEQGSPRERYFRNTQEASQWLDTLLEFLENTIFEHHAELDAFHERFEKIEEENRILRSEVSCLRRENEQLAGMKEDIHGAYSEVDALKRQIGLIPPLPSPYRRAQDPRGAPFALWRRDRTRAKYRPLPILTNEAQATLPSEIKEVKATKQFREQMAARPVVKLEPLEFTFVPKPATTPDEEHHERPSLQGLKRGREEIKLSPTSPRPRAKRRKSASAGKLELSAKQAEEDARNDVKLEPTRPIIDLCSPDDNSHDEHCRALILVRSHALPHS